MPWLALVMVFAQPKTLVHVTALMLALVVKTLFAMAKMLNLVVYAPVQVLVLPPTLVLATLASVVLNVT